jgi:hypothetical protein
MKVGFGETLGSLQEKDRLPSSLVLFVSVPFLQLSFAMDFAIVSF